MAATDRKESEIVVHLNSIGIIEHSEQSIIFKLLSLFKSWRLSAPSIHFLPRLLGGLEPISASWDNSRVHTGQVTRIHRRADI